MLKWDKNSSSQKDEAMKYMDSSSKLSLYDKMTPNQKKVVKKEAQAAINTKINNAKVSGQGPQFANNIIKELNNPNSDLAKQAKIGNTVGQDYSIMWAVRMIVLSVKQMRTH